MKRNRRLSAKTIRKIPNPVLQTIGNTVIKAVDTAVEHRWGKALDTASKTSGAPIEERVLVVQRAFQRELTGVGAAGGALAAGPGFGTVAASGLMVADISWVSVRIADLIMTLGAVYGHIDSTVEQRRAWVLSILAFGNEAAEELAALISGSASETLGAAQVGEKVIGASLADTASVGALRRANSKLTTRIFAKFGARKGITSMGRLLPFGFGAVIGGGANFWLTRNTTRQATTFFQAYKPNPAPAGSPGRLVPPMPGDTYLDDHSKEQSSPPS